VLTVILAGGYATRLWPITWHRPKPLLPVAGKPLLDYLLESIPAEFLPVILSVNRRFSPAFARWAKGKPVELVVEETQKQQEKLGAIGAVAHLIQNFSLKEDLLVLGGDNWLRLDLRDFVRWAEGHPAVALFPLGAPDQAKRRYGVAVLEGARIVVFQEKPEAPRSDLVSTACYFFPKDTLPLFPQFLAEAPRGHDAPGYFIQWLLSRRVVRGYAKVKDWLDVGDRASYLDANLRLTGGASWIHPQAKVVRSEVLRSVILGPCLIENARLEECVVDRGAKLQGVELCRAMVGEGAWLRG
jgi:glucose-1-phosphate thymidylyltransferase